MGTANAKKRTNVLKIWTFLIFPVFAVPHRHMESGAL